MTLDVLIIGAGPSGLACAIEAQRAGLNYLVVEKGVIANSIFHFPSNMTFFSTSKLLEIGDVPFISHADKPTRREALEYYRRIVDSWQLKVRMYERVLGMSPCPDGWALRTEKGQYRSKSVVVSTGFYDLPRMLNIPGEELPKVRHYYDEAHPYIGQNVLVVGAANSACDVALETWQKGAKVTMAIRSDSIHPKVKYWIRPNIQNRIREGSITAHFNTQLEEITPHEVRLRGPKGRFSISNDFVLAMTGYQPDYSFLKNLGIQIQSDNYQTPVFNPDTLETNLPGVFLAGVIAGGMNTSRFFIENTRHHGKTIVEQLSAVYTNK